MKTVHRKLVSQQISKMADIEAREHWCRLG